MEIHALRRRGWSISAIARHVGKDRRTVRAYLDGKRQVGVRAPAGDDAFARYLTYCTARLAEDPHLWATALFDEVTDLGYDRSYPSFTRAIRLRGVRPVCEPCHPAKGRPISMPSSINSSRRRRPRPLRPTRIRRTRACDWWSS